MKFIYYPVEIAKFVKIEDIWPGLVAVTTDRGTAIIDLELI